MLTHPPKYGDPNYVRLPATLLLNKDTGAFIGIEDPENPNNPVAIPTDVTLAQDFSAPSNVQAPTSQLVKNAFDSLNTLIQSVSSSLGSAATHASTDFDEAGAAAAAQTAAEAASDPVGTSSLAAGVAYKVNKLFLSNYLSGDYAAATDKTTAFTQAFNDANTQSKDLIIDCPVQLNISSASQVIVAPSNFRWEFRNGARLVVNKDSLIPLISFYFVSNFEMDGMWIDWRGSNLLTTVDYTLSNNPPYTTQFAAYRTALFARFQALQAANGGSFASSGVTKDTIWNGPIGHMALLEFRGNTTDFLFKNLKVTCPDSATAANFVPQVAKFYMEHPINTLIDATFVSTYESPTNNAMYFSTDPDILPRPGKNGRFDGMYLDGVCMGIEGFVRGMYVNGVRSKRYADTGTDGVGNFNTSLPAPHLIYLQSVKDRTRITDVMDFGIRSMTGYRSVSSGTLCSLKAWGECTVDGYESHRPDGGADVPASYGTGLKLYNICLVSDSSVTGGGVQTLRFPATSASTPTNIAYANLELNNISVTDLNPAPTAFPISNTSDQSGVHIVMKNAYVYLQDWPGSGNPSAIFYGKGHDIEYNINFKSYSSTTTYSGPGVLVGANISGGRYKVIHFGYRSGQNVWGNLALIDRVFSIGDDANPPNHVEVYDKTNGQSIICDGAIRSKTWKIKTAVTLSGASVTVSPQVWPSGWNVSTAAMKVTTAMTGCTGLQLGISGNLSALGALGSSAQGTSYISTTLVSSPGSQQSFVLTPGGNVTALAIGTAGSGYTNGTYTLNVSGGGGTGAVATATISGGAVASVNLTNGGGGYTSNPTFSLPSSAGAGSGAAFTPTIQTGVSFTGGVVELDLTLTRTEYGE